MTLAHLVKYSIAVRINLCLFEGTRLIGPMKSSPAFGRANGQRQNEVAPVVSALGAHEAGMFYGQS